MARGGFFIPFQCQFGAGHPNFLSQVRIVVIQALDDLLLEDTHQTIVRCPSRVPEAFYGERDGKKSKF